MLWYPPKLSRLSLAEWMPESSVKPSPAFVWYCELQHQRNSWKRIESHSQCNNVKAGQEGQYKIQQKHSLLGRSWNVTFESDWRYEAPRMLLLAGKESKDGKINAWMNEGGRNKKKLSLCPADISFYGRRWWPCNVAALFFPLSSAPAVRILESTCDTFFHAPYHGIVIYALALLHYHHHHHLQASSWMDLQKLLPPLLLLSLRRESSCLTSWIIEMASFWRPWWGQVNHHQQQQSM